MKRIVRKIEMLPINLVHRNMAQANLAAAEAFVAHVARAFAWFFAFWSYTVTVSERSDVRTPQ